MLNVYFVCVGDNKVKIGITSNLKGRLKDLKKMFGEAGLLAYVATEEKSLESQIHSLLVNKSLGHEVFNLSYNEVVEIVSSLPNSLIWEWGDPVPEKRQQTIILPKILVERLKLAAEKNRRSLAKMAEVAITEWLHSQRDHNAHLGSNKE